MSATSPVEVTEGLGREEARTTAARYDRHFNPTSRLATTRKKMTNQQHQGGSDYRANSRGETDYRAATHLRKERRALSFSSAPAAASRERRGQIANNFLSKSDGGKRGRGDGGEYVGGGTAAG